MAGTKRKAPPEEAVGPRTGSSGRRAKRRRSCQSQPAPRDTVIGHMLLPQYYRVVQTLREFVLAKLPTSSKSRRRKIESIGLLPAFQPTKNGDPAPPGVEAQLGALLDTTLVCHNGDGTISEDDVVKEFDKFTQSQLGEESRISLADGLANSWYSHAEVGLSLLIACPYALRPRADPT